ncbi:hypothetical protein B566_EDAN011112 [Ephemera danica]|nr:hypothetical protein B566_EDAN011112 [Ephemera danica]
MSCSKYGDIYNKPRRTRNTISEEQVTKNLLELMERTNYPMVQENGQRTYGPCPDWNHDLPRPSTSCEVYVSQIPNNCFEDVLVPLFASIGKIYTMRLMLDFKVGHRGFAFVQFTKPEDASEAIRRLDKFKY